MTHLKEPTIAVIDDDAVVRTVLRAQLEEEGLEIVGEASHGEQGIDLVLKEAPDVVTVDLMLPGLSGIEVIRRLLLFAPASRVLVISVSATQEDIVNAIRAGATGYLDKSAVRNVGDAVRRVARGERVLSDAAMAGLADFIQTLERPPRVDDAVVAGFMHLTPREREILGLLADGMKDGQIAARLFISRNTVRNHVASVLEKLRLENRTQAAVAYAVGMSNN